MRECRNGQGRIPYALLLLIDGRHRLAGRLQNKIDRFARLIIRAGKRRGCT
jgi:hypothetical protein